MPVVCLEALRGVVVERELGVALDCDVIVIIEADQLAESQMAGVGRRFVRDAFHDVAIAGDEIRVMIHH